MIALLNRVFRPSHDESKMASNGDALEFLSTEEAQGITLHEFEERFEINDVDFDAVILGYPDSLLYEPESKEEVERNRRFTDEFLKSGTRSK